MRTASLGSIANGNAPAVSIIKQTSFAKGSEQASSDADLFVVSDSLSYAHLYESLAPVNGRSHGQ